MRLRNTLRLRDIERPWDRDIEIERRWETLTLSDIETHWYGEALWDVELEIHWDTNIEILRLGDIERHCDWDTLRDIEIEGHWETLRLIYIYIYI